MGLNLLHPGRKCTCDTNSLKYLVQVRDDVEAGDEKLRELKQEMKDWGIFDMDFCLGDVLGDDDPADTSGESSKPTKKSRFPCSRGR